MIVQQHLFPTCTVLVAVILLILSSPTQAQESRLTTEPVIVGWSSAPPFYESGKDGEPTGYYAELARLIGEEAGVRLRFRQLPSVQALVDAQNAGEVQLLAGSGFRARFEEENLFSDPVAQRRLRYYVRADRKAEIDLDGDTPLKVGYLQWASRVHDAYARPNMISNSYNSISSGMYALLSGATDLFLGSDQGVLGWSWQIGLDHRIAPLGPPLTTTDRSAVLHKSRAELMPAINAAIARLKNRGALAQLRRAYRIEAFTPAPAELIVGVRDFPPFQMVHEDGSFSGFGVDVFRDIARLADISYKFVEIDEEEFQAGPSEDSFDIVPLFGVVKSRRSVMDFAHPVDEISLGIFMRRGESGAVRELTDLVGRRVSVPRGGLSEALLRRVDGLQVVTFADRAEPVQALANGDVDATVLIQAELRPPAFSRQLIEQIEMVQQPILRLTIAPGLRAGLADIRERLNAVIPGYVVSDRYHALQTKAFGPLVFWNETRRRLAWGAAVAAGLLILVMAVVMIVSMRGRRRAEWLMAQTRDVSERLSAVMNAAQSSIVALNREGKVALANDSARQLLGQEGPPPYDWPSEVGFVDPSSEEMLTGREAPIQRAVDGQALRGEMHQLTLGANRNARMMRVTSTVLVADVSPGIGTVIVLDDVTEQERHREQAERASRLSSIGQLTGGIAHDFNNILAVVVGNLELLSDELDDPDLQLLADSATQASLRGSDLTRKMLAFARRAGLKPEVLDLNKLVLDAKSWIGRTLPASVLVETSLLAGLWQVSADRASVESALLNLIVNARDAMDGRGSLTIETANLRIDEAYIDDRNEEISPGRYVMLAVSDTGCGMDRRLLAEIFDPFFTTKEVGKGSGLGLSMVIGFMRQSDGSVQVYSEPGKGTTFKLYFPVESGTEREREVSPTAERNFSRDGVSILLVEDNSEVRRILETNITRAGFRVVVARNGDEARVLFEQNPQIDLLLTDIVMPGELQGTGLARVLRQQRHNLPVIFMSGYANEATVHGNGLRPEDIRLMKPVQRVDLLAAIERALQGGG